MKLSDLRGVGSVTLEKLEKAGIEDIEDLAKSNEEELDDAGLSERKAGNLLSEAKKNAIIIQSGEDVIEEYENKDTIPSGMGDIDDELNGGWEEGSIIALAGESSTGKTQVCFQSLVSAVEQTGKPAVYIETERNRYSPKRLKQLSDKEDTQEKIHRIKAYDLEQQKHAYGAIIDKFDELSLVVVDSFTARFRLSNEFEGRGSLSDRSIEMKNHLKGLEEIAEEKESPILLTAQVYGNPSGYGTPNSTYGGSLFHHTVNFFLMMQDGQGEMKSAKITNHPEVQDTEFLVNISTDSVNMTIQE